MIDATGLQHAPEHFFLHLAVGEHGREVIYPESNI